ncbi:MAG TPA: response regulator transcription factor [Lachnospiraceae bacterium]|nr:response regulator transcription factor [Lachnospiraceae bacterium]
MLVIDDEIGILNFINIYFTEKKYQVFEATCGMEALQKLSCQPDIILLDIMMPDIDGIELCQVIRNKVSCPILFLSARSEEQDRIKGLSVGGDDYIIKPFSIEELYARVEAHLRREARRTSFSAIKFFGKLWVDYTAKQAGNNDEVINLTQKEFKIVEYLSMNKGQTFSKERIYEHVWGYDIDGDADIAVTEHIKRIRKKLKAFDTEYIETVWGIGYRWKS